MGEGEQEDVGPSWHVWWSKLWCTRRYNLPATPIAFCFDIQGPKLQVTSELPMTRPATTHFSTIRYISRYSCHDMVHDNYDTLHNTHNNVASCLARVHRKSIQLTSLVGSMRVLSMDFPHQFVRKIVMYKD